MTLQEANAIAVIDLNQQSLTGVYSAGYEDYSTCAVDIDKKDEAYKPAVMRHYEEYVCLMDCNISYKWCRLYSNSK